jgi:hypothetical protein
LPPSPFSRTAALSFDPVAQHFVKSTVLEPDFLRVQEFIRSADPLRRRSRLAVRHASPFKGLIDRALTADFGLRYSANGKPQGLLKGKTMDIPNTADAPLIPVGFTCAAMRRR